MYTRKLSDRTDLIVSVANAAGMDVADPKDFLLVSDAIDSAPGATEGEIRRRAVARLKRIKSREARRKPGQSLVGRYA